MVLGARDEGGGPEGNREEPIKVGAREDGGGAREDGGGVEEDGGGGEITGEAIGEEDEESEEESESGSDSGWLDMVVYLFVEFCSGIVG